MSRNKKRKKTRRKVTIQTKPIEPKPNIKKKVWYTTKKVYAILAVIFTIISWIALKDTIHKWVTPDYILFKEENFVRGILLPDELLEQEKQVCIGTGFGLQCFSVEDLKSGVDFIPNLFACEGSNDYPFRCRFKIIGNRFFISDSLKSLSDDELVGIISDNKWEIRKQNMYDYKDDDERLQVEDKQGNIMLSVYFQAPNKVFLQGYFIQKKTAAVIYENGWIPCINKADSNWKDLVTQNAAHIKSVF